MKVQRVSFRLTRAEVSALLKILDAKPLAGTDLVPLPQADAVIEGLMDGGILTPGGDVMIVDRALAVVLLSAAYAQGCSRFEMNEAGVILYRGKRMDVLLEWSGTGMCSFTPIMDGSGPDAFAAAGERIRKMEERICKRS